MCILNISSPVPHTCEVIHKCHSFPFPAARGLLCRSCSALRPRWALGSASHHLASTLVCKLPPRATSSWQPGTAPREPQGHEAQVQEKPQREKVSAHLQPNLSCPGQTLPFPQKMAQSSLTRGPPRPQGHPLTALSGPDPVIWHSWTFNHMQKNVNGSAWNKKLSPWRCTAWHSSQGVNQLAGEHKWERLFLKREKLAGPECWPPAPSPKWFHFWLP